MRAITLGIISDIHADLYALRKALRLLVEQRGVDHLVCAGDLVGRGLMPDQVVALLVHYGALSVLGNHDQRALTAPLYMPRLPRGGAVEGFPLRPTTLIHLAALPATCTLHLAGCEVLVAHGAPWSNRTYIFPDRVPESFRDYLAESKHDLVVLGHTHQPMVLDLEGVRVVNPGSVCRFSGRDSHSCAIVHLPTMDVELLDL